MTKQTSLVVKPNTLDSLSQRQKAAIIVRLLVGGGTSIDSLNLDADSILKITQAMTGLGVLGRDVVDAVTAEFIIAMQEMGMIFESDMDGSLSLLADQISSETMGQVKSRQNGTPDAAAWQAVSQADPETLAGLIGQENPRIGAVILSKLTPSKSAEIVEQLDAVVARKILQSITKISEIDPDIVAQIGIAFADNIKEDGGGGAFRDSPAERIGAILNVSRSDFRDDMLENFREDDPEEADRIRKLMFTFEDIPTRIVGRDISKILRGVDDETLSAALSGAATTCPDVKEFIMANISSRLAEQLEESITDLGPVKPRDADAAMTKMIVALKELESAGDIKLIELAEEEDLA